MAAKKVASALHVLTSDGYSGCDEWPDNNAFEALVADYFTGSADESSEESDDDTGIFIALNADSMYVELTIGETMNECNEVVDEYDSQDEVEMDFGKKYINDRKLQQQCNKIQNY